jgi:hypothetical protein
MKTGNRPVDKTRIETNVNVNKMWPVLEFSDIYTVWTKTIKKLYRLDSATKLRRSSGSVDSGE